MPSFGGEVKPSVPCRRFAACKKTPEIYVEVGIAGKIDRPFLAQFLLSLKEVSHVAWRGAPLEMTGGTKGGAQRASSLRPRCVGEVDPETATRIYLSIYLSSIYLLSIYLLSISLLSIYLLSIYLLSIFYLSIYHLSIFYLSIFYLSIYLSTQLESQRCSLPGHDAVHLYKYLLVFQGNWLLHEW
jgi:hypothetical protein